MLLMKYNFCGPKVMQFTHVVTMKISFVGFLFFKKWKEWVKPAPTALNENLTDGITRNNEVTVHDSVNGIAK